LIISESYNTVNPDPGVLTAIGNTPLVRLSRIMPGSRSEILVKLEFMNPGGSVKDRIARYILQEARRTHRLGPGGTVVEYSSGSTGVSVAMVAAALDLRALLVVTDKTPAEKIEKMRSFGAHVEVAPDGCPPDNPQHGYRTARRLAEEQGALYFDQFHNPLNPQAHYLSTGPEIWRQCAGRIDVLVAGIGTGGTLSGTARFLKERQSSLRVVAVDAAGSVLSDYISDRPLRPGGGTDIEGLGSDILCRALDRTVIDEVVTASDDGAFEAVDEAARMEGLRIGGSAGAALWAAMGIARQSSKPLRIVAIAPDSSPPRWVGRLPRASRVRVAVAAAAAS
jgi:cysteine synthase